MTPATDRFTLLSTTRHLAPLAVVIGLLFGLLSGGTVRLCFLAGALGFAVIAAVVRRRRPVLVLTESGYQVEVAGRVRFSVAWSEVVRVLCDRSEEALYVDCGDSSRNLLLPPQRGYAFTFERRAVLFRQVLSRAADKVQEVEDLERIGPAPPASQAVLK